jgi:hypothetical protein
VSEINRPKEPGAGNLSVALLLIRVMPAHLESVWKQIDTVFLQRTKDLDATWYSMYACIGDYDLAVVSNAVPEETLGLGSKWLRGILGVRHLPFCVTTAREHEAIRAVAKHDAITVTFLQIHPSASQESGLQAEQELVERIRQRSSQSVAVVPLYGIPELVVLSECASLVDIPRIADLVITLEKGRSSQARCPLIYRTLTFPCLAHQTLFKSPSSGRSSAVDARLEVHVSCIPGYAPHIQKGLREVGHSNSDPGWMAGEHDVHASFPVASISDLSAVIRGLVALRRANQTRILSTSCSLGFSAEERPRIEDQRDLINEQPILGIEESEIEALQEAFPGVGHRLVRMIFAFNDLATNPHYSPRIVDMVLPMAALVDDAVDFAKLAKSDPDNLQFMAWELSERLMPVHAGVDQRTISAHPSISPVESPGRHVIGGVARTLLAAEAVALSLIHDAIGSYWTGYCVVGVRFPGFYHEHQVIDIPPGDLWRPESWCGLIHESMHALIELDRRDREVFGADQQYDRILKDLRSSQLISGDRSWIGPVANEVTADILTLAFGPSWDLELYFKTVWSYFREVNYVVESWPKGESYFQAWFFRSVCTWISAHLPVPDEVGGQAQQANHVWECTKEMRGVFRRWGLTKEIEWAERRGFFGEQSLAGYVAFLELIRFVHLRARELMSPGSEGDRRSYFSTRADHEIEGVMAGKWDFGRASRYPELLVWRLRQRTLGREETRAGRDIQRERAAVLRLLTNTYWHKRRRLLEPTREAGRPV